MADDKGDRIRAFFQAEAEALLARFKNIERLIPHASHAGCAHTGEEGRFVEELARSFLRRHLPEQIGIGTGFILRIATKEGDFDLSRAQAEHDRQSRQLDVIIYDRARFPVYESFGDFVIVPCEAVLGVISVKKTLYGKDLAPEVGSLREVADLCHQPGIRGPHLGLLAFQREENATPASLCEAAMKALKALPGCRFDALANEIAVLNEFVLFKFCPDGPNASHASYCCVAADGDESHVVLQRLLQSLLSVFYHRQAAVKRPGFVSFNKGTFMNSLSVGQIPTVPATPQPSRR